MKKVFRIIISVIAGILLLLVMIWMMIQTPWAQRKMRYVAEKELTKYLHTEVKVGKVSYILLNKLGLKGVLIHDQKGDTLVSIGSLNLKIGDWFFRNDTISLSYLSVNNASIHFQRKDSIWNNAFLDDIFSGNDTSKTTQKPVLLKVNLVHLKNIRFEKMDYWRGKLLKGGIEEVVVKVKKTDIPDKNIQINELNIAGAFYQEFKVAGLWTSQDSIQFWKRIDSLDLAAKNEPPVQSKPWKIDIAKTNLTNSNLRFFNRRAVPSLQGEFDDRDIIITHIEGQIKDATISGDTIRASVRLQAKERSGIEIKDLSTQFTMHPQLMEFAQLDLKTNRSRLGPYYAMRYSHFDDMEYFVDRVKIEAHLREAKVDVRDIAVFAPEINYINQLASISGDALGTVSDFEVKNLNLKTGKTDIRGTYSMKGLIDIDHTMIHFTTTGSKIYVPDIAVWAPPLNELRNTPVEKLGVIAFKGKFDGTAYDFKSNGHFETLAGNFDAGIELNVLEEKEGYVATIENTSIDGGYLLGVPKLGKLAFNGTVSSNGFSMDNPILVKGEMPFLQYKDYDYRNIQMDGIFVNNKLDASLVMNDTNLNGNLDIALNLNENKQRYNARGLINHADFKNLRLLKDSVIFKGRFDVDFAGNTIDEFLGYAKFYETHLTNGLDPLSFDSLILDSKMTPDSIKILTVHTNEASAEVQGNFTLSSLSNSFKLFLNRYYPAIIKAPEIVVSDQDFTFEIKTQTISPFLSLFDDRIGGLDNMMVHGMLNTEFNQMELNADVPYFSYNNMQFSNVFLQGNGNINDLNITGSVGNYQLNDRISFPNGKISIATRNDSTRLLVTTTTSGPLGNTFVDANILSDPGGFELIFNESNFVAGNKKWTIEQGGGFQIKDGYLVSNGLTLFQNDQKISIYTQPDGENNWNNAFVNIRQVSLGDWIPYFIGEPRIEGLATGKMQIKDPLGNPKIIGDIDLNQFVFNNDSIGYINLNGEYEKNLVRAFIKSPNRNYDFDGRINLNFSDTAQTQINTVVNIRNERINILKKYLAEVFDDIDGYASGDLFLTGRFDKPDLSGNLKLKDASLLVEFTKCKYFIDSGTIKFGGNSIDFGSLNIRDGAGRAGKAEGIMYHRLFDSLSFNIKMQSDNIEVLNTLSKDNDLFYGSAIAKVNFDINGPLNNLQMRIVGTPTDSSVIYITNKDSRTNGEADYIVFKEYGKQAEESIDTSIANFHVDLELAANPLCRVDVILDEMTGDIISATGVGNLFIRSGTAEPTVMRGRYVIENGSYKYTFQSFIRKPFLLKGDGNNYLEWNGDPYEANLNITATYIAKDVSLRDLLASENALSVLDQDAKNYKGDVWINAKLKGNLSSPSIDFDIEFPPGSVMRNNYSALDMLRRIKEDPSENLRQVTYLIVFRSFAPYRQGASQRNPGADLAVNTISEVVSREMEKILTGIVQDLFKDQSLSVDLSTSFYSSSQTIGNVNAFSQYDRVNVNFNLNYKFLNSRVLLNVGSDFDVNVRSTATTGFQFLPDVSIEFILTDNRRLRAILFKRDNLDIAGRRNRAGASISYRKDFDKLFGDKKDELLLIRPDSVNTQPIKN